MIRLNSVGPNSVARITVNPSAARTERNLALKVSAPPKSIPTLAEVVAKSIDSGSTGLKSFLHKSIAGLKSFLHKI